MYEITEEAVYLANVLNSELREVIANVALCKFLRQDAPVVRLLGALNTTAA